MKKLQTASIRIPNSTMLAQVGAREWRCVPGRRLSPRRLVRTPTPPCPPTRRAQRRLPCRPRCPTPHPSPPLVLLPLFRGRRRGRRRHCRVLRPPRPVLHTAATASTADAVRARKSGCCEAAMDAASAPRPPVRAPANAASDAPSAPSQ